MNIKIYEIETLRCADAIVHPHNNLKLIRVLISISFKNNKIKTGIHAQKCRPPASALMTSLSLSLRGTSCSGPATLRTCWKWRHLEGDGTASPCSVTELE